MFKGISAFLLFLIIAIGIFAASYFETREMGVRTMEDWRVALYLFRGKLVIQGSHMVSGN